MEANAVIPGMEGRPTSTLTFLHLTQVTEDEVIQLVGQSVWDDESAIAPEQPQKEVAVVEPPQHQLELVKVPQEITEVQFGENKVVGDSPLRLIRKACQFYGLAQSGSKATCWNRLTLFLANAELDAALEVAKRYQDDMVRQGNPVPMPKEVSEEEKQKHELTHLPRADWCEACTATKSKEDPHKSLHLKEDGDRVAVHIDFGYLTGEPTKDGKGPSTTFLMRSGHADKVDHRDTCSEQRQAGTQVRDPAVSQCYSGIWIRVSHDQD